jgi:guanyl-specific ribonuclease Sa
LCQPDTSRGSGFWNWVNKHWQDILNVAGGILAAACSWISDEEGASQCEKLAGEEEVIPQNAEDLLNYIESHNGSPPPGYVGGSIFRNEGGMLPQLDPEGDPITYREYDINPRIKEQGRGRERIVIGSDGSVYYTSNHYKTFIQMR